MEEQLRRGLEWDDYEPEAYGWQKSPNIFLKNYYNYELAAELHATSIPHKTRHFRKL